MRIIHNTSSYRAYYKNLILAIGIFDGVHRGHQALIQKVVQRAKKINGTSMVVTFFPHPVHVLGKKKKASLLISLEHRLRLIEALGVDVCVVIRFTKRFAILSAEDFVKKFLIDRLQAKEVFVGSNFHFGKERQGRRGFLKLMAKKYHFKVSILESIRQSHKVISSSSLRKMIPSGDMRSAEKFLNRHVSVFGMVCKGSQRGRRLGFPTANIYSRQEILPPEGVYVARVVFQDKLYFALANIGRRPSFEKNGAVNVEVHVLDFHGNMYGKKIEVQFLKRLRSEKTFTHFEDLITEMNRDKKKALKFIREQFDSTV